MKDILTMGAFIETGRIMNFDQKHKHRYELIYLRDFFSPIVLIYYFVIIALEILIIHIIILMY